MAPLSMERGDARPQDPRHQSMQPLENAACERWEDEGGATRNRTTRRFVQAPTPRSHHFGEGQIARTITQDEQDRLAGRS
jgi:hypothetical protein